MENEKFDIGKLFRGFNIFSGASIGKLIYTSGVIILILSIIWGIYWKVFLKTDAPIDQSSQQADNITNITQLEPKEDLIFLGLKVGSIKLGIRIQ